MLFGSGLLQSGPTSTKHEPLGLHLFFHDIIRTLLGGGWEVFFACCLQLVGSHLEEKKSWPLQPANDMRLKTDLLCRLPTLWCGAAQRLVPSWRGITSRVCAWWLNPIFLLVVQLTDDSNSSSIGAAQQISKAASGEKDNDWMLWIHLTFSSTSLCPDRHLMWKIGQECTSRPF